MTKSLIASVSTLVCLFALAQSGAAQAEEFTMTRGYDGKTFFCADHGGSYQIGQKATVCDCKAGPANYGQVVSLNAGELGEACKQMNTYATLSNCTGLAIGNGGGVSCDCKAGAAYYGQVISAQAGELRGMCQKLNAYAILSNCKAH